MVLPPLRVGPAPRVFPALAAIAWLAAASLMPSAAHAAAAKTEASELPAQSVHRDLTATRLNAGQGELTLLPGDWEGRTLTLADLLAEQAGIETRRYGGLGSFQTLSIRGATGARVKVYLDDIPLNSAGGGPVDLGKIDLVLLERIEVRKGIAPAEDGGNSLGGVIRLYTRGQGDARAESRLSLGAGSHGLQRYALSAGSSPSGGGALLSAFGNLAFTRADNDFDYLDRNQTPYNPDDDRWTVRKNSAYRDWQGHAQVNWALAGGQLRFKLGHSENGGGLPGKEGQVSYGSGFSDRQTQYHVSYGRGSSDKGWQNEWSLSVDEQNPAVHWTKDDPIGWSIAGDTVELFSRSQKKQAQWRLASPAFALGAITHEWLMLAVAQQENLKPWEDETGAETSGWNNGRRGLSLALDWKPVLSLGADKSLAATLGGQAEWLENRTEGANMPYGGDISLGTDPAQYQSWRLGLLGRPSASLSLYTNLARFYRLPGLVDLFGGRWGMLANPELKPEQGLNFEAGARWHWPQGFAEACFFRNSAQDAILYQQSASLLKAYNLDASLAQGLEFSARQEILWGFNLSLTATAQDTRNTSATYNRGKRLPDQPSFSHHLRESLPLPGGFVIEHRWERRSEVFRDPGNLQRIPAQNLQHVKLHWSHGRRVAADCSVQNITDEFYEDAYASYPYPGRQVEVTLNVGL